MFLCVMCLLFFVLACLLVLKWLQGIVSIECAAIMTALACAHQFRCLYILSFASGNAEGVFSLSGSAETGYNHIKILATKQQNKTNTEHQHATVSVDKLCESKKRRITETLQ